MTPHKNAERSAADNGRTIILSFRDLRVWQAASDLVIKIYHLTSLLPRTEVHGLATQMQRAAVSVPANIAEGSGRDDLRDYLHLLSVASGSLMELETLLLLAERLAFLPATDVQATMALAADTGRMLTALIRSLRNKRVGERA